MIIRASWTHEYFTSIDLGRLHKFQSILLVVDVESMKRARLKEYRRPDASTSLQKFWKLSIHGYTLNCEVTRKIAISFSIVFATHLCVLFLADAPKVTLGLTIVLHGNIWLSTEALSRKISFKRTFKSNGHENNWPFFLDCAVFFKSYAVGS